MKHYALTIRVKIEAEDDPMARAKMRLILGMAEPLLMEGTPSVRLQELYKDKPPRKVTI